MVSTRNRSDSEYDLNEGDQKVEGQPIHVLMVDDHELMRQAYGTLLGEDPGIEIVGLAGDGQQGVAMAAKLQPDVIIMDGRMPRMNGVDAAKIIRETQPDIGIVLLSAYNDDEFVRDFLAGDPKGKAYMLKQSLTTLPDLIQAIRDVSEGKAVLAPPIVATLRVDREGARGS